MDSYCKEHTILKPNVFFVLIIHSALLPVVEKKLPIPQAFIGAIRLLTGSTVRAWVRRSSRWYGWKQPGKTCGQYSGRPGSGIYAKGKTALRRRPLRC